MRKEVSSSIDDLEKHFGNIEMFIMTFPDDQNIVTAVVQLVAAMLKAIEDVIGYYIKNESKKTFHD